MVAFLTELRQLSEHYELGALLCDSLVWWMNDRSMQPSLLGEAKFTYKGCSISPKLRKAAKRAFKLLMKLSTEVVFIVLLTIIKEWRGCLPGGGISLRLNTVTFGTIGGGKSYHPVL